MESEIYFGVEFCKSFITAGPGKLRLLLFIKINEYAKQNYPEFGTPEAWEGLGPGGLGGLGPGGLGPGTQLPCSQSATACSKA